MEGGATDAHTARRRYATPPPRKGVSKRPWIRGAEAPSVLTLVTCFPFPFFLFFGPALVLTRLSFPRPLSGPRASPPFPPPRASAASARSTGCVHVGRPAQGTLPSPGLLSTPALSFQALPPYPSQFHPSLCSCRISGCPGQPVSLTDTHVSGRAAPPAYPRALARDRVRWCPSSTLSLHPPQTLHNGCRDRYSPCWKPPTHLANDREEGGRPVGAHIPGRDAPCPWPEKMEVGGQKKRRGTSQGCPTQRGSHPLIHSPLCL